MNHTRALTLCGERLVRYFPDVRRVYRPDAGSNGEQAGHLLWMVGEALTWPDTGKADRWLGFIQGWLWRENFATVAEMRGWNTGDPAPR